MSADLNKSLPAVPNILPTINSILAGDKPTLSKPNLLNPFAVAPVDR